jgi:hypothetical protein
MDLSDIYRIFQATVEECTFFSAIYGTFSKLYNILRPKSKS